jgi:hypothetical protein
VDLSAVAAVIQGASQQKAAKVRWCTLGAGVVAVGLDSHGAQRWLVERPAGPAAIHVDVAGKKRRLELQKLPPLLAELAGRRDETGQAWLGIERVFCLAGGKKGAVSLSSQTALYACPMPNCYGDGRVCMGSVDQKLFRNLSPLEFFERAFVASTFTDHAISEPLSAAGRKRFGNVIKLLEATGGRMATKYLQEVGTYGRLYA